MGKSRHRLGKRLQIIGVIIFCLAPIYPVMNPQSVMSDNNAPGIGFLILAMGLIIGSGLIFIGKHLKAEKQ